MPRATTLLSAAPLLSAALLLAFVGGLGLTAQTATAQSRDRAQQNGRQNEPIDDQRQRLIERQQRVQLQDIQARKDTLVDLRISFQERGVPGEDDLREYEIALQELILAAGLDPASEMAELGGFMFIEPVTLEPAPGARGGAPIGMPEQPGEIGQFAAIEPGTEIELNFAEPVDLSEFAKFVARTLSVNIFADPALEAEVIQFMAPVKIPREDLLPLLAALVEERGFVLLYDRLGFYKIEARGNIPPGFGPDAARSTSRMISTPLVRPSQLVPLIESLFGTEAQASIRLTPLDDLGVLVVSGPPRVLDNVEDAVARFIERQQGQQYFNFQLEHVSAEFARDRLLVITGEVQPNATAGRPATPAATARPGGTSVAQGSLSNLSGRLIVGAGNTLIFRGDPAESELVRALLESIDSVTRLIPRRYTAGSVAEQAAIAASELGLGPVEYADQTGSAGTFGGGVRTSGAGGIRTGLFGGGPGEQTATISGSKSTVDLQNGTIVYHGTESQHRIFQEIVDQFVEDAVQDETVIRTYKIDNVLATDLRDLLEQLIEDPDQQLGASPLFPGQNRAGQAGITPQVPRPEDDPEIAAALAADPLSIGLVINPEETRILAYEIRNELIIKAKPSAQRQFERLIQQLDQRQPQVQLNVQIVSVSTSNNFDWGADFQANIGDFFSFSTFGVTEAPENPFDPPGFGVNQSGIIAGIIDTSAVSLVIEALETVGDTRLVSNPSIIVNDNVEAVLESVRTEPFPTTSQGGDTTITSQGGTETAGTTLTVTPQISSGGYISLVYSVELSSFDLGGRQPGLAPPTQREVYDSSVTLPSDSTIVVGGFRQATDSDNESRVPILGSIPIIGNVFKSRSVTRQERTIFVFITPRILDNPRFADLRLITEGPSAEAEIKSDVPQLDSVRIPIRTPADRTIPHNRLIRENLLIESPQNIPPLDE